MDIIKRAILFGGKALVSVMDTTDVARTAKNIHGFSAPVTRAMARFLTMGAFICSTFLEQKFLIVFSLYVTIMLSSGKSITFYDKFFVSSEARRYAASCIPLCSKSLEAAE